MIVVGTKQNIIVNNHHYTMIIIGYIIIWISYVDNNISPTTYPYQVRSKH